MNLTNGDTFSLEHVVVAETKIKKITQVWQYFLAKAVKIKLW